MKNKNLLVTGATGRLGANLVKQAVSAGYNVRALCIPDDPKASKLDQFDIEVVVGDLRDTAVCEKSLDDIDVVVHTANIMAVAGDMSHADFFDVNAKGTFNLVWAAGEKSGQIRRFVHVSSDSIYPSADLKVGPDYYPIDEAHPKRPVGMYGITKHANEVILNGVARTTGLSTTLIRPSGMFAGKELLSRWTVRFVANRVRAGGLHPQGPMFHPNAENISNEIMNSSENPGQWCAVTDLQNKPWVYQPSDARDVADICLRALEHPEANGEAFNVAVPEPFSYPEVAEFLSSKTGEPVFEVQVPSLFEYRVNLTKARNVLGFIPRCDLETSFDTALKMQEGIETDCVPA